MNYEDFLPDGVAAKLSIEELREKVAKIEDKLFDLTTKLDIMTHKIEEIANRVDRIKGNCLYPGRGCGPL